MHKVVQLLTKQYGDLHDIQIIFNKVGGETSVSADEKCPLDRRTWS